MVLSPAGLGQVPAMELSLFEESADRRSLSAPASLRAESTQDPTTPATA
jgi:hypothetical protein